MLVFLGKNSPDYMGDTFSSTDISMTEAASRYWLAHDRDPEVDVLAAQLSGLAWAGMRGLDG